jgi:hypothetical protein
MSCFCSLALREEGDVAHTHRGTTLGKKWRFLLSRGCNWQHAPNASPPIRVFSSLLLIHSHVLPFEERMSQGATTDIGLRRAYDILYMA